MRWSLWWTKETVLGYCTHGKIDFSRLMVWDLVKWDSCSFFSSLHQFLCFFSSSNTLYNFLYARTEFVTSYIWRNYNGVSDKFRIKKKDNMIIIVNAYCCCYYWPVRNISMFFHISHMTILPQPAAALASWSSRLEPPWTFLRPFWAFLGPFLGLSVNRRDTVRVLWLAWDR